MLLLSIESVTQRQRESAEENMRRFRADLKRESEEFDIASQKKFAELNKLERELMKDPDFAEVSE